MFKSWLIFSNGSSRRVNWAAAHGSALPYRIMIRRNNGQRASSRPKAIGGLGADNEY
jgi:hypothetical protein